MDLKERAIALQAERDEFEDIINRGISKFNNVNSKYVDYLDTPDSGWQDQATQYVCGENGITITWFDDIGRCGGRDYETETQTIPYIYFEEDDDLDEINADIDKRKRHEARIKQATLEKTNINSKRLELEKEIRELNQFKRKYDIDVEPKIKIATDSLSITKIDLERQEAFIKDLKNEL